MLDTNVTKLPFTPPPLPEIKPALHWSAIDQTLGILPIHHLESNLALARSLIGRPVDIELRMAKQFVILDVVRVHGEFQFLLRDVQGNRSWERVSHIKTLKTLS